VLGIILLMVEIATPTFFTMWIGIGAISASLLAAFFEDQFALQLVVFIVVSFLLVISTRKLANKLSGKSPRSIAQDQLIGETATVTQDILPDGSKGIIKVAGESWRAVSVEEEHIKAGSKVKILALKGVKLYVERVPKKEVKED